MTGRLRPSPRSPWGALSALLTYPGEDLQAAAASMATIDAAVESVRAQTFEDFELLAIDDGSTDATAAEAAREVAGVHLVLTSEDIPDLGDVPNKQQARQPDGTPHPRREAPVVTLDTEQLRWLLDGIDLDAMVRHPVRQYEFVG
mgnify:CR=1 FL=1